MGPRKVGYANRTVGGGGHMLLILYLYSRELLDGRWRGRRPLEGQDGLLEAREKDIIK
jgi:hypothetical protein